MGTSLVVPDFDAKHRPYLESLLDSGETLEGVCAANWEKGLFSNAVVILGVTNHRLLVQPVNRRGNPDGELISIAPEQLVAAKAGSGGSWASVGEAIMDQHAAKLRLETTEGTKLKLMFMHAQGGGLMAKLGGGEGQRQGVEALARWFGRAGQAPPG